MMQTDVHKPFIIRKAELNDVSLVLDFINKLADYEKLSHDVVATEADLEDLFVLGEHRGKSYGKKLLARLAALALERD
jgi:GNAT superfamily N-acetyltransferase